ncbi:hypothetical protein L915_00033 [Phytophthora nicotianae]|nr:hypothetical protein L915_00033 [Phytophthora nicotianae]
MDQALPSRKVLIRWMRSGGKLRQLLVDINPMFYQSAVTQEVTLFISFHDFAIDASNVTRSGCSNQVERVSPATTKINTCTSSGEATTQATTAILVSSTAIVPPYLTDVSHLALVKWKRERQELCKFECGRNVEEVTEDRIVEELNKIVGNVMNDAILGVDSIFNAELKMNLKERDVKARVINYFMRYFSTATGIKEKCKILKMHLEPAALGESVDSHIRLVDASSKSDENAEYLLVTEKALEQEIVYQLLNKRKQQPSTSRGKARYDNGQRSREYNKLANNRSNSNREILKSTDPPHPAPVQSTLSTAPAKLSQGRDVSTVAKIADSASVRILTKPERKPFWPIEKVKKAASNDKNKRFRVNRVEISSTTSNENSPTVLIYGKLELPYCADSVSDTNIISCKHVDLLCEQDATVVVAELDAPIVSRAIGGGMVTSTHAVDVRITLNTAAGPVRCQDAKRCLIVEADEDEFIVGKLLLAELGIDVDRQLEYLASRSVGGDYPIAGFWQLPLDKSCQEILSYMTDKGVFTPMRVPQGSTDAALHFQSTIGMVLGNLVNNCVIVWIDDLLVFADTAEELVDAIEAVLVKLDEHDGVGHDPKRIEALQNMPVPTTAEELQQFLWSSNWMRSGLVDYARLVRPLQERLGIALAGTKKTKRAAAGIKLDLTIDEVASFESVKELLGNSAMLTFPDPTKQFINHSPVPSLANRAPIELFTGLPCPSTLDSVFLPGGKGCAATLSELKPKTEQLLAELRASINCMHKAVKDVRQRQSKRYKERSHYEQTINFPIGDYVLRSRVDKKLYVNKLRVVWVGPYRVVGSADYYFTVEHLMIGTTMDVHPSRLKFHAGDSLNVNEELIDHIASQGTLLAVEAFVEHRLNPDMQSYKVKVKWFGLEPIEDSWKPIKTMSEDVPQLLLEYATSSTDDLLLRAVMSAIDNKKRQRSKSNRT